MKTTSRLGLAIVAALMLVLAAPIASAVAAPELEIASPANESVVTSRSITVVGTTNSAEPVTVRIEGHGAPIVENAGVTGTAWSTGSVSLPSDGEYSLVVEQGEATKRAGFFVNTEPPDVSIFSPSINHESESVSFSGHAGDDPGDSSEVLLEVYEEGAPENEPIQVAHVTREGDEWHSEAVPLPPGGYYVRAFQEGAAAGATGSSTRTFTVTSNAPTVVLNTSAFAKQDGTLVTTSSAPGFSTEPLSGAVSVTLRLYAGTAVAPEVLELLTMSASGEVWSAVPNQPLADGLYTAQAEVRDLMGETGFSSPVIFSVQVPAPAAPAAAPAAAPSPPVASFTWVPTNPTIGQSVSLVSNSTDASSTINAFAWDPAGTGAFAAGGPAITTSFATAGPHVVHLRVTDGNGLSAVATQTINVGDAPLSLMQPFPIVRIAGTLTGSGAMVKLLTVQAPLAAKVAVSCKGHGCPTKPESRLATASSKSKTVAALLTFTHFERALRAGAVLQIRVSKVGEIGKFTSFTIRWHKLPLRSDACLRPTSSTPIACPAS
jgi:hypothetical protein